MRMVAYKSRNVLPILSLSLSLVYCFLGALNVHRLIFSIGAFQRAWLIVHKSKPSILVITLLPFSICITVKLLWHPLKYSHPARSARHG